ncbi:hypothetical protein [Nocardia brevicatena]|uniref:hypothetical protein n=1 Tax=Nocardia brevicatena TaxID=37327 RepID=UPI000315716C|nr:hypothetical protein [Nocardia brevicatena]
MTEILYPDAESVDEITARYLLSMPTGLMPLLYGFRYNGESIDTDCVTVDLSGSRSDREPNPIHLQAARLRKTLGPDMFGFGFVFVVFADQLDDREENGHIPPQIRTAAGELPGTDDLIAAVTIDATGRQWWAVVPRHLPDLDPIRLHIPATPPEQWRIPETLDASLWTAALALDTSNRKHLLGLLPEPDRFPGGTGTTSL